MNEISSHFALIAPEAITENLRLQKVTFIPATGSREFACTAPVSVDQTPSTGNSGLVWTISFSAVTPDCAIRQYSGRRFYIGVIMSDGSARIIGSAAEAPLITVTPHAQNNRVSATFKSAVPIDL
jgi:hypothetical protein